MTSAVEYWDRQYTEPFALAHHMRQNAGISMDLLALMAKRPAMDAAAKNAKCIVEIGCGTGELVLALAAQYRQATVVGTEISAAAVQRARLSVPAWLDDRVRLELLDASHDMRGHFESCDLMVASQVLEHFKDPWTVVDNMLAAAPRALIAVPFNQSKMDGYSDEGGAGHVYRFTAHPFYDRYKVIDRTLFSSLEWSCKQSKRQMAILIERKGA